MVRYVKFHIPRSRVTCRRFVTLFFSFMIGPRAVRPRRIPEHCIARGWYLRVLHCPFLSKDVLSIPRYIIHISVLGVYSMSSGLRYCMCRINMGLRVSAFQWFGLASNLLLLSPAQYLAIRPGFLWVVHRRYRARGGTPTLLDDNGYICWPSSLDEGL